MGSKSRRLSVLREETKRLRSKADWSAVEDHIEGKPKSLQIRLGVDGLKKEKASQLRSEWIPIEVEHVRGSTANLESMDHRTAKFFYPYKVM